MVLSGLKWTGLALSHCQDHSHVIAADHDFVATASSEGAAYVGQTFNLAGTEYQEDLLAQCGRQRPALALTAAC
jgi:hypothetical protein